MMSIGFVVCMCARGEKVCNIKHGELCALLTSTPLRPSQSAEPSP